MRLESLVEKELDHNLSTVMGHVVGLILVYCVESLGSMPQDKLYKAQ